ncbi:MAG: DNA repair exonuclease [Acidobacteriota bacterium]
MEVRSEWGEESRSSRDFAFLHCADLHLDAPLKGLRGEHPELARRLRLARRVALERLARRAVEGRAAFWILAGDLFDRPEPSLGARRALLQALEVATEGGVRCFLACGNHDPAEHWPRDLPLPPGAHLFSAERVESFEVLKGEIPVAVVEGLSHLSSGEEANLARRFRAADRGLFSVAVLHAQVGDSARHGPYAPAALDDLVASGHDYWALGHVHQRGVLHREQPWVVYPGFLQGRSLRESGPGGGVWVEVKKGAARVRPVEVDAVRFERCRVVLEETLRGESEHQLVESLLRLRDSRREAGRGWILRLLLSTAPEGPRDRSPAWSQLWARPGWREELLEILREGEEAREDFVWIEGIEWQDAVASPSPGTAPGPLAKEVARIAQELREELSSNALTSSSLVSSFQGSLDYLEASASSTADLRATEWDRLPPGAARRWLMESSAGRSAQPLLRDWGRDELRQAIDEAEALLAALLRGETEAG